MKRASCACIPVAILSLSACGEEDGVLPNWATEEELQVQAEAEPAQSGGTPAALLEVDGAAVAAASRPFPQGVSFPGAIKPNHLDQNRLNQDVLAYYQYWKQTHVKASNGGTPGGGYYVKADSTGSAPFPIKSNSEAHGYGMIIFALMGDKAYYDGMFNMFDQHRSSGNKSLMSWVISESESPSQIQSSATDGDMDIAYSLLLAHDQWGSAGAINYLAEAKKMITDGIKASDMGATSKRTKLGDWDSNGWNTRASDWMAGHMRAYQTATNDVFWRDAANTIYSLISTMQNTYSPNAGLMPDFIVGSTPQPANPGFLEGPNDGKYSWNSCRFPWRTTTDYLHHGTPEAKTAMTKVVNWLKPATGHNPSNIRSGYELSGSAFGGGMNMAFAAPFIAACTIDPAHQDFLNRGWDLMKNTKSSYYSDSIDMLCLLLISGNWWKPGTPGVVDTTPPSVPTGFGSTGRTDTSVSLGWSAATDNIGVSGYSLFVNGVQKTTVPETSATITGLTPSTTYTFTVKAMDAAGNSSEASSPVSVTTTEAQINLALNKPVTVSSTEAGGNVGTNAVDGNGTTRWSSAYSDPQWISVDLGAVYNVNRVALQWEAAYGKAYRIEVSTDGTNWVQAASVPSSDGGYDDLPVTLVSGRYVRMYGTARATQWGYSLWEFSVFGKAGAADTQAPTTPANLTVASKTQNSVSLSWTASTDNVGVTGYDLFRNGTYHAFSTGTAINITGLAAGTTYTFSVKAKDAAGNSSAASNTVSTTTDGVVTGTNLATNKPVTVSSTEGAGFEGVKAVDGQMATRWASKEGSDAEWIYVDLGARYKLTKVVLNWETAYAKDYAIQVSDNGATWSNAATVTNENGGKDEPAVSGEGRYVRINCAKRGTAWGYSLYELEVYGTDAGTPPPPPPNSVNVALNKTVTVSSTEGAGLEGAKAVDGSLFTRWASAYSDPQWIAVDLSTRHNLSKIVLNWETAYAKTYTVQVSDDGAAWTAVHQENQGNGAKDEITLTAQGRYLRINCTARGTAWGYSLYELEVFGALAK